MDPTKFRLRIFLIVFFVVIIIGTFGFMVVENLSPADAFYFSIVTIATVGYGDIHPATQVGKLLAIILIMIGVGTFLGVVASATDIILNKREKQLRMEKMNMVIGVFFSEVGTSLLVYFSNVDPQLETIKKDLMVTNDWLEQDFLNVTKKLRNYNYNIDINKVKLENLRNFLKEKTDVLLRLLENPNVLEHESFTELLRAVFHFKEELLHRENVTHLPDTDKEHLAGDMKRIYTLLVHQWLDYMEHLKDNYPYLFSLSIRTNPFDREASPIVQ